ncbi:MAG: putative rane protein [Sphingomonas bacterium]|uniref:MAPEG family protein n=1 Tax=Sphingomonas bacterium TaxID=1895847 RepID=UPI002612E270|nr:MAPEG family protein [Sphingomonas bacterium]MDB5705220.1 putative rane protein [Sphingomonas bacterium]
MELTITGLTAASLALLLVFLSVTTIRMRMKHSAAFGDAGQHDLTSAIRAHGNLTEYAPMGLILIGLLEAGGANHLALAITAAAFFFARVLNAWGLFNPPGPPGPARSIGIVATLAILLGMAVWLLVRIHMPGVA